MRRPCWIMIATACSAPAKPIAPVHHAVEGPAPATGPTPAQLAAKFCDRVDALRAASCAQMSAFKLDHAECASQSDTSTMHNRKAARFVEGFERCVVDSPSCEATGSCIQQLASYDETQDLRGCQDPADDRAAGIRSTEFQQRNGAGVTRFAAAQSSKDRPIEMCGIAGGIDWLTVARCDDGSHPIVDRDTAEASRAGNVGSGGRCGSVIDLYKVKCPERSYDIYVDGYICPIQ